MELAKYFITICIALYTYECFAVFRYENVEERNGIYIRQNILMILIHFAGLACIAVEKNDLVYWFYYAFQQIIILTAIILFRAIYPKINRLTINNIFMLLTISFIMLTRLSFEKSIKQFIIVTVALALALVIPHLIRKFQILHKFTWIYGGVGIVSLLLVLILGAVTNGSKLSFSIVGISFQPSEFVKILYVFFLAGLLYESQELKTIIISAICAAAHVIILVLSRDLGSALIYFIVYVLMVFVATKKIRYLLAGLVTGCGAAMLGYRLFSHVRVRVQTWRNPWDDIEVKGYQITQSLFAIGTGGWFGLGIGKGSPNSIPYVETDFIFAAIGEEMGIIFALCLVLVCVSCFIMFMNIAIKLKDNFYKLIALGLGVTYGVQVFLTIGGGVKFIPLTGVTLPLVSYGGSSVIATLIIFSIIQGFYMIQREQGNFSGKRNRKATSIPKREEYEEEYEEYNEEYAEEYEEKYEKEYDE